MDRITVLSSAGWVKKGSRILSTCSSFLIQCHAVHYERAVVLGTGIDHFQALFATGVSICLLRDIKLEWYMSQSEHTDTPFSFAICSVVAYPIHASNQRGLTKLHIIFGSFCILYAMVSVTVLSVSYSAMSVWFGPAVQGDNFEVCAFFTPPFPRSSISTF